ncbi:MAG: SPFH domain-containing protein [Robiginitomaculum sp.]|nr:SPFH domain-containing protein [Robiginitomaculum sp.]
MKERHYKSLPGIPVLIIALVLPFIGAGLGIYFGTRGHVAAALLSTVPTVFTALFLFSGLYKVEPNQSAVLSLFGKYVGTTRTQGLRWNNIFFAKKKISLRIRNFESGRLKVNDSGGSPIEIAAIVVWEVTDSSEAVYNVDDYESFVQIQSEAAIRSMASIYPYDPHEEDEVALRSHPIEVSTQMKKEIQERLTEAGITVIEARISHLAYSPEIAQAMLQRQQAGAIIAARTRIVEGAVGMVEMALDSLKEKGVVDLDEERRAAMVSNLLVVLCSDRATQPVVNTGSIY